MGIDWETILDAEGADMADAYEDMVFDAMEKMDREWPYYKELPCEPQDGYGRCIPFPGVQAAREEQGFAPEDYNMPLEEEPFDMYPELGMPPSLYLGSTAGLNAINDRIFNVLLSIQGFIVDSGAVNDSNGCWKLARDLCAAASFPIELTYGAEKRTAEERLDRYRYALRSVMCAAGMPSCTDWAAPGRSMAYLDAKLAELDEEIQKYDETLHGCGQ